MIKVWCADCDGKGIISRNNGSYLIECSNCNRKGYTEHEGELADLELAAAVRAAFEKSKGENETILFINSEWSGAEVEKADAEINCESGLLDWYREQEAD